MANKNDQQSSACPPTLDSKSTTKSSSTDTMDKSDVTPSNIIMKLPAEIRIDICERVINAGIKLISESKQEPSDYSLAHHAMLVPLRTDCVTRKESLEACITLANSHIAALEAKHQTDHADFANIMCLSIFAPLSAGVVCPLLVHSIIECMALWPRR
jgi:hypothetical protein